MKKRHLYSKNRIAKRLVNVVVIVAIVILFAALIKVSMDNLSDKFAYSNDYSKIYGCDYQNITKISILNTENNVLLKNENQWVCENAPDVIVGDKEILKFVMNFRNIVGNLVNSDDFDFGFDKPLSVITLTDINGKEDKFILGNWATNNEGYYFKYENNENIYVLNEINARFMFATLADIRTKTIFEPIVDDVLSIKVKNTNGEFFVSKYNKENPSKNALLVSNWHIVSPIDNQCKDKNIVKNLFNDMILVTDGFYEDNAELYEQYKLNKPVCKLQYTYIDESEKNISIGEVIDDKVYVKIEGDQFVYRVPSRFLSVLTLKYHDLLSSLTEIEKIDNVTSIDITYNDVLHSISVEKAEGQILYKCDGKPITKDAFNSVYELIMSLYIEGNIELSGEGTFVCSISIVYNDGLTNKIIDFYTYEDEYAAIIVNGELNYFTSLNKVQSIIDEFEKLV